MVTLASTQNLNEFELHARAVLGLPIGKIDLFKAGASAVILADQDGDSPYFTGLDKALEISKTSVKIFGKPNTRLYRRMGVVVVYDDLSVDITDLRLKAKKAADFIKIKVE